MDGFAEQTQTWRVGPPLGAADGSKPYLNAPGYLRKAKNVVMDRRTMRRRPFRRKLNHTAAGASGIRLRREAVIPWSRHTSFSDADFSTTEHDLCLEFWFRNPTDAGFPATGDHRVPVAFQGSRVAEGLGYGGGPGYTRSRTVDAPLTLNLARLSGDWYWELYGHPGTNRIAVKAAPFIRQHVSIVLDQSGSTMTLRNSDDGEGNEVTASMALAVNDNRQHWRFRGPAEKAATPEDPPYFELECIRLWHTTRSASEIQDNRNHVLDGDTVGLVGQWTGDGGTRDWISSNAGVDLPMFFTADYPSHYSGAYGSGVEIANPDLSTPSRYVLQNSDASIQDGMKEALDTTYASLGAAAGGAFDKLSLQYAHWMKVKLLEINDKTTTAEHRGIHTGQFEIAVEPTTGKVFAYDAHDNSVTINSGATRIGPGESHVIGVERDGSALYLYIDGVLVATGAGLDTTTDSAFATANKYGTAVTWSSIPGSIILEELAQFYGKPQTAGVNIITAHPNMDVPDSIDDRVTGNVIEAFGSFGFINGSATVEASGAGITPRVGDFLIDLNTTGRRTAYRIQGKVGTVLTLATNYTGPTGTNAAAVTRCLFYSKFDTPWSTESNKTITRDISGRLGNQNLLANVIDDEIQVLRPLWLANGVTGASTTTASSHLERTTRFAGLVKRNEWPAAGMARYQKEGEIDAKMTVWGTTLYWISNGWFRRESGRAGGGKYALLNLDRGFLYPSNGSLCTAFDGGVATDFSFSADLEPGRIDGKRALYIKGRAADERQVWIYFDDGKLTAKVFYDNGSEQSVILQTDRAVVRPNEVFRVDVFLDFDNSGNSYLAVDGEKRATSVTGTWPSGGDTANVVPDTAEALFGVNQNYPDIEALEDGMKSFVGFVYGVRGSTVEEATLNEGIDGPLAGSASTELLLSFPGEGWKMGNGATSGDANAAVNGAPGMVPVMEDLPYGDDEYPYSMDQFRASLYGTNGRGRQFYAKWSGDFTKYPTGWESGFSGILPPKHLPRLRDNGVPSTNNTAGDYLVAYAYIDTSTGLRSNPSPILPITMGGTNQIELDDLQASEDPRVDGIEIYMTQAAGTYIGKVLLVGNEAEGVILDVSPATIRVGDELSLANAVPPVAKQIHFSGGRAYWAGIEGNDGVLTFSEPDLEESWDALNQKQVDSSRWGPIVGMGGQRGAVHVFTKDSIFRVIPGPTDITTFQFLLVVSGIGAIDQFSVLEVDGMDMFMSRDGLFAFNGASTQFIGEAAASDSIGVPGVSKGADPRSVPMWSLWDPRRHIALWFHRNRTGSYPTGDAICMSRRITDKPGWSTLDFYDVSAAASFEDIDGIPGIVLADSMGYAWSLEDPAQDTDVCLDLDGLGNAFEDGTTRTLVGADGTNAIKGHQAGDGARGFTILTYDEDAEGVVTDYGVNRLLRTPASSTLVAGDVEGTLGSWDKWVLGGFLQSYESAWGPYPSIEVPKEAHLFDAGFSPLANEKALILHEGVQGNSGRAMENEITSDASRLMAGLDYGFLEGLPLRRESRFRALRYALQYFGTKNLDVAELVVRWSPEGGGRGPGG